MRKFMKRSGSQVFRVETQNLTIATVIYLGPSSFGLGTCWYFVLFELVPDPSSLGRCKPCLSAMKLRPQMVVLANNR
jgi:hypothetical protein